MEPWTWRVEENRGAPGTEDKGQWPHSSDSSPGFQSVWWAHIGCSVQPSQLQAAPILVASAKYFFWDHPSTHPSFKLPHSHSSGICLAGWIWLLKRFRKSGDFKSARNYTEVWPRYLNTKCLHLQRWRFEFFMVSKKCVDCFEIICLKFWK